jgi:hypothetical protein
MKVRQKANNMIQDQPQSKRHTSRNQCWLVMATDRELLHRVWAMQAIWEFDILEINDLFEIIYWMDAVKHGTHGPVPDVALIEWRPDVPGTTNEWFLQNVRHNSRLARLPVIVMCASELSSATQAELRERYGVDAVVSKPLPKLFEINDLIAEVRQTVKHDTIASDTAEQG